MITNYTNTPNFKAKFIDKTQVKKLNKVTKKYENIEASFLEFDPKNKKDLKTLKDLSIYWNESSFAWDICETAKAIVENFINPNTNKVYILTKQKDNFKSLKYNDVLGLADVESKENNIGEDILEIHRLQVDPEFAINNNNLNKKIPEIKHIGTEILNILKKFNKTIELNSVSSALDFYEINGFKNINENPLNLRWRP